MKFISWVSVFLMVVIGFYCVSKVTPVMEDSFVLFPRDKVKQTIVMSEITYEELKSSLFSAEEAIDSLNSYVSRLEWAVFKLEHPNQARLLELEDEWEVYIVEKGEILSGIALAVNLEWKMLFKLNEDIITDPNVIYPGQVLKVRRTENED